MLFNTIAYAKFFAAVFVVYWLIARHRLARLVFLLGASYAFYSCWDWRFLPLIVASSTLDYWLALRIDAEPDPRRRRRWLVLTCACNLGLLGFFKYWNFGAKTLATLLAAAGLREPGAGAWAVEVALPVGISFYTFESMSYVVDVYRRSMAPCRSYLRYLLFVAFFPHLVAGPIVRPAQLLPQFDREPELDPRAGGAALFLIAVGLLKKVVIGDYLALNLVDRVFDRPAAFSALEVLGGVYGYALQIYCDFSGYTDVALGSAALLGIKLNENFRSPYQSADLQEFWRRWHVSLSTWLRDYLYIPLGGSRGPAWKTYRNLILTMALGGLWHGASWNFVAWGLLHGVALAATRAWQRRRHPGGEPPARRGLGRAAGTFVTFHYVCFAWVFFRAETFAKATAVFKQLGTLTTFRPNLPPTVLAALAAGALTHALPDGAFGRLRDRFAALPAPAQGALLFAAAVVLREVATSEAVRFIYFQF
jgi:D-alanyl-lipoteichoic acid acyltransferase DltB (MBOAT superfamily)